MASDDPGKIRHATVSGHLTLLVSGVTPTYHAHRFFCCFILSFVLSYQIQKVFHVCMDGTGKHGLDSILNFVCIMISHYVCY